jgi:hypothetical protein
LLVRRRCGSKWEEGRPSCGEKKHLRYAFDDVITKQSVLGAGRNMLALDRCTDQRAEPVREKAIA